MILKFFDQRRIEVVEDPDMAGVILIRPGVEGLSLGNYKYRQVLITVGDPFDFKKRYYIKGLAKHCDQMPEGKDIIFYTQCARTAYKLLDDDILRKLHKSLYQQKGYIWLTGGKRMEEINGTFTTVKIDSESLDNLRQHLQRDKPYYQCYGRFIFEPPTITRIICNGPATIVFFDDKTKVVVKRNKDDQQDIYAAVAFAVMKKLYGSNSRFKKIVTNTVLHKED